MNVNSIISSQQFLVSNLSFYCIFGYYCLNCLKYGKKLIFDFVKSTSLNLLKLYFCSELKAVDKFLCDKEQNHEDVALFSNFK